ncbi:hypothetical protein [Bradyrhizobium sp. ORS 86]|uniref:hypothetical protein n=1 Tax=unclassified Bradyrhizobium TaxID=2631580 RepID=UPI00388DAFA8
MSALANENVRPVVSVNRTDKYSVLWLNGAYHYFDFSTSPAATDIGYTARVNGASRNYAVAGASPANIAAPTVL